MDSQWHFVCEYHKNEEILVAFVSTLNQDADIMTKNVSSPIYKCQAQKLLGKPPVEL